MYITDSLKKILESWEQNIIGFLPELILAFLVLGIFYLLGKIFQKASQKVNSRLLDRHPDLIKLFSASVYFFFLLSGIFLALKIVGLEPLFTKILAGAGIVGIIAGFALKDIASNAFSGLLLFVERPFRKGDWVQLDGHYGTILNIGWLTTTLKNVTGQEVFISNQLIYSGSFINYSGTGKRRVIIRSDVLPDTDAGSLETIAKEEIKKTNIFMPDEPTDFYIIGLGTDGLYTVELRFWFVFDNEENFLEALSQTIRNIKQRCKEEKITIANTQWISDEEDSTSSGNYGSS